MVAIWNALPGAPPLANFKDRKAGTRRLWGAFQEVPITSAPKDEGVVGSRPGSKQERVIQLLQRPEGVTVDEVAGAMGWQRHTVRGHFSGALKKKLGLEIVSEKTDQGRRYRILKQQSAA